MKDSLKTILFATVLGVVCAGLLTAASYALKPYQEANERAEKWRNIFMVLNVPADAIGCELEDANAQRLLRLVRSKDNPSGKVARHEIPGAQDGNMTFYTYDHPDDGTIYAFEFSGMGLWGHVEGLLSLQGDLETVYSISFYKQEETPGLGGEIGERPFREGFRGKTIAGAGEPGIRIRKPDQAVENNEVDGISAATLTCDKVEAMINEVSKRIIENRDAVLAATAAGGPETREAGL